MLELIQGSADTYYNSDFVDAKSGGAASIHNPRGIARLKNGEYDHAIADFSKAIELDPENVMAYQQRGITYYCKEDIDKAIEDYNAAIALDPEFAEAYLNRGQAYYAKNEVDKAIADYDKAIQLNSELVETYTHRGNAYRAKAELDSAIADYTEALTRRPKVPESYYIRGEAWLLAKGWEEAKTDLTAALLQDVDVAAAFHNNYGSIAAFERKIGVRLPKEIVELLTSRSGSPFEMDKDARIALGMKYYGNDELSSGLAARLAGVSREEFWYLMRDYGLSLVTLDEEELPNSGF